MAEVTKTLEEQLADQSAYIAKLEADREATLQENKNLRAIVKDDTVGKVVKGSVKLKLKTTAGKEKSVKVGFKSGYLRTLVIDTDRSWNEVVSSEALLAAANDTLTDEQKAENPLLAVMSPADAARYMEYLAKAQYAGLDITE